MVSYAISLFSSICQIRRYVLDSNGICLLLSNWYVSRQSVRQYNLKNQTHIKIYNKLCPSLWRKMIYMMTSSNGNIFRLTKASDGVIWCFLWSATGKSGGANNQTTGYLRRHRAHYNVTVMITEKVLFWKWIRTEPVSMLRIILNLCYSI